MTNLSNTLLNGSIAFQVLCIRPLNEDKNWNRNVLYKQKWLNDFQDIHIIKHQIKNMGAIINRYLFIKMGISLHIAIVSFLDSYM